ncbi:MAG: hypothetical protein EPO08_03475 [Rhodospirillaceae bacterium]|nr:MAG: hypothetical protein EPO08_03475 [Rhodospirillaceae bacterium]
MSDNPIHQPAWHWLRDWIDRRVADATGKPVPSYDDVPQPEESPHEDAEQAAAEAEGTDAVQEASDDQDAEAAPAKEG